LHDRNPETVFETVLDLGLEPSTLYLKSSNREEFRYQGPSCYMSCQESDMRWAYHVAFWSKCGLENCRLFRLKVFVWKPSVFLGITPVSVVLRLIAKDLREMRRSWWFIEWGRSQWHFCISLFKVGHYRRAPISFQAPPNSFYCLLYWSKIKHELIFTDLALKNSYLAVKATEKSLNLQYLEISLVSKTVFHVLKFWPLVTSKQSDFVVPLFPFQT